MLSTDEKGHTTSRNFMTGCCTDQSTGKKALSFFGTLLLITVMTVIVCMMTSFENDLLRIALNSLIAGIVLVMLYYNGLSQGTEAVIKGEILQKKWEKTHETDVNEKKACYHPLKGLITAMLGSLPIWILALILALNTEKQMTGPGVLPGWTQSYLRRPEIGDPLYMYTHPTAITAVDIIRIIVRASLMPFSNIIGSSNPDGLLWMERLSPLLVLFPALAFGAGYLGGPGARKKVHAEIAENAKIRAKREAREKRKRKTLVQRKGPEQLN